MLFLGILSAIVWVAWVAWVAMATPGDDWRDQWYLDHMEH